MTDQRKVVAERLGDLGGWELYRLALEDGDDVVSTIALRASAGGVDYGVWRRKDADPSATGTLDREAGDGWSNEERELALQEILSTYAAQMPELRAGVVFAIDGSASHEDDDED